MLLTASTSIMRESDFSPVRRNSNWKRELTYLAEDLQKDTNILIGLGVEQAFDQELLAQIQDKVRALSTLELGVVQFLDSIQYLIGELRIGMDEWERHFVIATKMIDDIQDFLDWQDSWT
jgi:hypothetical protein